jgi:hypothetical protein
MVTFNASETSESGKGFGPGLCHFVIEDGVESADGTKATISLLCVASTNPANVNKKLDEVLFFVSTKGDRNEGAFSRLCLFAVAAGLMTRAEWHRMRDAKQDISIEVGRLRGRQCVCELQMEDYKGSNEKFQGRQFANIGFRIYGLNDKEAAACPKNPQYANMGPPAQALVGAADTTAPDWGSAGF